MPFQFLEFFAGAGLVHEGLKPKWECVWANDIDPSKAEIYKTNFSNSNFVLGDVTQVKAESLPDRVDMAWASFPCQDLSLAGWQRGMSAKRSGTFWAFWGILRDLFDEGRRPGLIVIENVPGLLYGDSLAGMAEALAAIGLQFGALVIDARHFVPQSRSRVFLVALDSRVDPGGFCESEPSENAWVPNSLRVAYNSLPAHLKGLWKWWVLPKPRKLVPDPSALIEARPKGVEWHTPEQTRHLLKMMTPINTRRVRAAEATLGRQIGFLYRRTREGKQRAEVRFDLAGCLRTPKGGSSRQTVLVVEGGNVRSRLLSPREAARLMGLNDRFWLPPNYNSAYMAMGDAVVVPVVRWLSRYLLEPMAQVCREVAIDVRGSSEFDRRGLEVRRASAERAAAAWHELRTETSLEPSSAAESPKKATAADARS